MKNFHNIRTKIWGAATNRFCGRAPAERTSHGRARP